MKALSLLAGLLLLSGCQHVQTPQSREFMHCETWTGDGEMIRSGGINQTCPSIDDLRANTDNGSGFYVRTVTTLADGRDSYDEFAKLGGAMLQPDTDYTVTWKARSFNYDRKTHVSTLVGTSDPVTTKFHTAPQTYEVVVLEKEQEDRLVQRIVASRSESTKQMPTALPVGHIYVERTDTGLNCIDQYPHFAIAWESRADGICYEADAPALRQP